MAETGESAVYYDAKFDEIREGTLSMSDEEMRGLYAAADELHKPESCPIPAEELRTARGIEVGHIFLLGRKYTDAMNVNVAGAEGKDVRVEMGTYGIGISRLVAAVIEASHDAAGIIWPETVAPFDAGIINLRAGDAKCDLACGQVYEHLLKAGLNPLYDDTDARAGEKFAGMDLIGLPWQLTIGPRGAESGNAELKYRRNRRKIRACRSKRP